MALHTAFFDQILDPKALLTPYPAPNFLHALKDLFKTHLGLWRSYYRRQFPSARDSNPLALGRSLHDLGELLLGLKQSYSSHI
jgi:hypothetical protein